MKKDIWLIGAGAMALDYIKVLQHLKYDFLVIGNGKESAGKCKELTGCDVSTGGIEEFLQNKPILCSHAIVSVGVEKLFEVTKELLKYGVKNILVEKPGALYKEQFDELVVLSELKEANVFVAYNRRFYASVLKAQEIIEEDGGVTSFNFEFTEWSHIIAPLKKGKGVKEKWFLANSTHVVDLAFYLGGTPKDISCFISGKLDWHLSSSIFAGAGMCDNGVLFSYQSNWERAGRWSVEILTKEHRLILRPMEHLQIQKRGTVLQELVQEIDYAYDENFKPGVFIQTKNYIEDNIGNLCTITEQLEQYKTYALMSGYSD